MRQPRQYQIDLIERARLSVSRGKKAPLIVLPTGGGKSLVATLIMESALQREKRALFIAPRRQLIFQIAEDLDEYRVQYGVIMSGEPRSITPKVSIASLDTLHRRSKPPADLIIVDEAHNVFGEKARAIFNEYPNAIKIGFTATPCRADGKGMGELYDDMIVGPSMTELISLGALVPMRYFTTPTNLDLSKIDLVAGDYNQSQLDEHMSQPKLVGDVVKNWLQICPDRQTVVFAVKRTHAMALQAEFEKAGVIADYIDGDTENEDRKRILRRIESGESRVIVSVDVLSYGWNSPAVSCAVMARPTKSLARYLQAVGRVLRPYPGKEDAFLIDCGDVVKNLGFVDEDQPWSLEGETKVTERKERERKERKEPDPIDCPKCHALIKPMPKCPECGEDLRERHAAAFKALDVELAEMDRENKKAEKKSFTPEEKQLLYSELLGYASDKGYKQGWAANKYRDKTQVWPRGLEQVEIPYHEIRYATLQWIRSEQIRWAKRKQKEQAAA